MLRTNFQITAAVDQIAKIAMDNALIANAQDVRSDEIDQGYRHCKVAIK